MKDFSRLFVINGEEVSFWTTSSRSVFVLAFEGEELKMEKKSGRDPLFYELLIAVQKFLLEYEKECGEPVQAHRRVNRYRFTRRTGYTGCEEVYIEVDLGDGFPSRHRLYRVAMTNKVPDFRCFASDFLDHLVGEGNLGFENGHYVPVKVEDTALPEWMTIRSYRPRLLQKEEGWTEPWQTPQKPADFFSICRQVSAKEPEPASPAPADEESAYDEYAEEPIGDEWLIAED